MGKKDVLESILLGGGWGTGAESRWDPVDGAGRGTVAEEWRGTGRGQCAVTIAASGRDILADIEGGRGSIAAVAGGGWGTGTSIRCFLALSAVTDNDFCFLLALGAG